MESPPFILDGRRCCIILIINILTKTAKNKRFNLLLSGMLATFAYMSRRFISNILNHCYQRTVDCGVLFYSRSDHLVFFTLYCILARKYGIQVLALCQMPDHVHDAVVARRQQDLVRFKRELNARFAKMYNANCGTSGPVFDSPFGSAPKNGAKAARSTLIYIANNPPEKQLVEQAEQYRWSYLLYALSPHPFSEPIVIRRSSKALRTAIRMVKAQFKTGQPMNYTLLKNLNKGLSRAETEQLTDFIISTYNVIDYPAAIRFFDTYPDMIRSISADSGKEHDLNEVFLGKDDRPYAQMTRVLMAECGYEDIHIFLSSSIERKQELFEILRKHTGALARQIGRYLHLPLELR